MKWMLIAPLLAVAVSVQGQTLKPGQALTKSARIPKGTYRRAASDDPKAPGAFVIRGNNIVVDFNGATLEGTPPTNAPDDRVGVGIDIQGTNVTLKNVKVRGYKVGLIARTSPGLKIIDCDFSYNWKQHLRSTLDREDESDWMSYHDNELDEWLRYGAAVYLRDCNNFEVRGTKAQGGQNGLMMTACNGGKVWNSNFSFLSGIGIGMYRSSQNQIMHNRIDWCVRGYSHGVYNRGQDSAGILIYEQSNKNVFAYNSVTHGGDGFFLWAGKTTMDSGKGGCNDNLVFGNDFSHAPTNGIEATFSRNTFAANLLMECWHGIWGGYSYDSKVVGNIFRYNAEAIAWEHGQNNLIKGNQFVRDNAGIHLWANASQDPNWGYAKARDTRSRDWILKENTFTGIQTTALELARTSNVLFQTNQVHAASFVRLGEDVNKFRGAGNRLDTPSAQEFTPDIRAMFTQIRHGVDHGVGSPTIQASGNPVLDSERRDDYFLRFNTVNPLARHKPYPGSSIAPKPLAGGVNPFFAANAKRGRRYILVDEWGPYDFKRPLLWPREMTTRNIEGMDGVTRQFFEVLGPPGKFVVKKIEGVDGIDGLKVGDTGTVPGGFEVLSRAGQTNSVNIELEYRGAATTDVRGIVTPAGQPVTFGYRNFVVPFNWTVSFFAWTEPQNPADPNSPPVESHLQSVLAGTPLKTVKTSRLNFASGGSFVEGVPADKFATSAEGSFEVPAGSYTLELTTDDGARVWVDDKLVIADAWKYQAPASYSVNLDLAAGKHTIRVHHFEIGGYSTLKVDLKPRAGGA